MTFVRGFFNLLKFFLRIDGGVVLSEFENARIIWSNAFFIISMVSGPFIIVKGKLENIAVQQTNHRNSNFYKFRQGFDKES